MRFFIILLFILHALELIDGSIKLSIQFINITSAKNKVFFAKTFGFGLFCFYIFIGLGTGWGGGRPLK